MAEQMDSDVESEIHLGFLEKTENAELLSNFFPSKAGGKPAWLSLKQLPSFELLTCTVCGDPLTFLLQVYAPFEEKDTCFHRTIFLFICSEPKCCKENSSSNLKVFRSQLSRVNEFYSYHPTTTSYETTASDLLQPLDTLPSLCAVCGCSGVKRCGKCHSKTYCCKMHQIIDWKAGHRKECACKGYSTYEIDFLFPEFEIVIETERREIESEKSEEQKIEEYHQYLKSENVKMMEEPGVTKDLLKMTSGQNEDEQFSIFQEQIKPNCEQVMRYNRGGTPLWVSSEALSQPKVIPQCSCGAPRQFEFQVMPQMLVHLGVDKMEQSIDWGTLLVYTCRDSCDISNEYHSEFVWKQDFSHTS